MLTEEVLLVEILLDVEEPTELEKEYGILYRYYFCNLTNLFGHTALIKLGKCLRSSGTPISRDWNGLF